MPKSAGVYGWWFRQVPGPIDTAGCQRRDGLTLLYAGIGPSRPPSNGKPPSSQNIRQRIRYHYNGNAEGSTLRKTLGTLLSGDLGIELRRVRFYSQLKLLRSSARESFRSSRASVRTALAPASFSMSVGSDNVRLWILASTNHCSLKGYSHRSNNETTCMPSTAQSMTLSKRWLLRAIFCRSLSDR
ncbi:GIY-YIG nuclease family protein [Candidatus Mycolicibacterium alkanivorans]|uniref:GIY-YIG nuclease family protein n=1 Tax=Candidatus Mycolicibacterium alkanivorans TaxID=2954114 RepID=UPI0035565A34